MRLAAAPAKGRSVAVPGAAPSCGALLFRISRASGEGLGDALSTLGMRAPEFVVLRHLYEVGPISQQELGRALRIHASNLVALIDELESSGALIRRRDPEDRRRYLLELTDDGLRRLAEAETAVQASDAEMLAPLTSAERDRLRAYLIKLAGHTCGPDRG